jgi:hypothetical protein
MLKAKRCIGLGDQKIGIGLILLQDRQRANPHRSRVVQRLGTNYSADSSRLGNISNMSSSFTGRIQCLPFYTTTYSNPYLYSHNFLF